MNLKNKSRIHQLLLYFCLSCVIALGLISIVGSGPTTRQVRKKSPGLYSLKRWNNWNSDVNGKVGHRLYVHNPTADCRPSGKWTASVRIISGRLPPGLTLSSAPWNIKGIPTKRGHWIVKIRLYNVKCGGKSYKGFEQELRFHIAGTGRVCSIGRAGRSRSTRQDEGL